MPSIQFKAVNRLRGFANQRQLIHRLIESKAEVRNGNVIPGGN